MGTFGAAILDSEGVESEMPKVSGEAWEIKWGIPSAADYRVQGSVVSSPCEMKFCKIWMPVCPRRKQDWTRLFIFPNFVFRKIYSIWTPISILSLCANEGEIGLEGVVCAYESDIQWFCTLPSQLIAASHTARVDVFDSESKHAFVHAETISTCAPQHTRLTAKEASVVTTA